MHIGLMMKSCHAMDWMVDVKVRKKKEREDEEEEKKIMVNNKIILPPVTLHQL